jgi:hypothetical protein
MLLQGLTLGENLDEAEDLYFRGRPEAASMSFGTAPVPHAAHASRETDLLGLFPPQEPKR